MSGSIGSTDMAAAQSIRVTLGTGAGDVGFNDLVVYGSVSPTSFKGKTIKTISSSSGVTTFVIKFAGINPQNFFAGAIVATSAGGIVRITTAAATYTANDGVGNSLWTWPDDPWTLVDSGNTRIVTLLG